MRFLIVALMIFLLPLRGWTGDAMATHMASQAVSSPTAEGPVHKAGAAADCAGHEASDPSDSTVLKNASGETCQACQACHTVALSGNSTLDSVLFAAPIPPLLMAAQFTSADAALGQKPPIL